MALLLCLAPVFGILQLLRAGLPSISYSNTVRSVGHPTSPEVPQPRHSRAGGGMTRLNYKAVIMSEFNTSEWHAFLAFVKRHNGKDNVLWSYDLDDKWAMIAMLRWGRFLTAMEIDEE